MYSGEGMKDIAMSSGFNVIGKTRAGINLSKLTNGMPYYYGSESWNMWARLSRAYVRQGINKGASFKLFLNNP